MLTRGRVIWWVTLGFIALAVIILGIGGYRAPHSGRVITSEGRWADNFEDPRVLAGWSDNVFLGSVVRNIATTSDKMPRTVFEVRVEESIKGDLSGVVLVDQRGGFDKWSGDLILAQGDPLLEEGHRYWFATRLHVNRKWHTPLSKFGDLPVETQDDLVAIRALLLAALKDEIPYSYPNPASKD